MTAWPWSACSRLQVRLAQELHARLERRTVQILAKLQEGASAVGEHDIDLPADRLHPNESMFPWQSLTTDL